MASTINSSTSNGIVITPDTSGEIELQANGVTKAKVTANGLQDANGNSITGGMYRNLIINGDMNIAQRGTSVTSKTAGGYFTIDRFDADIASGGTWSQSQSTEVPSSQGFTKSYKLDCTATKATLDAGSKVAVQTKLEGQMVQHLQYGSSNAQTVTLSFWVRSSKTGTYTIEYYLNHDNRHYTKTYTIDTVDTWEKKTITITGDTTGVVDNDNTSGLLVKWWLAAGSNFTGGTYTDATWATRTTANAVSSSNVNIADSTSNDWYITGVQLEVGSGSSDFEFLPYDVQLARCQRYFVANFQGLWSFTAYSSTDAVGSLTCPVPMRTNSQSLGYTTGSNVAMDVVGGTQNVTFGFAGSGKSNSFVSVVTTSGLTGRTTWQALGMAGNNLYLDAEL